jgi:hypothetical protein
MAKKQNDDSPGLKQIETKSQRREPLDPSQAVSMKSREAMGWTPQSEATGVRKVDPS